MPTLVNPDLIQVPLEMELAGRLRNIGRPKHWYMAIAEAVKNSMDAIEEANDSAKRDGWIEVSLQRVEDLASKGGAVRPVKHVTIRDNGVGFDEKNFKSFCKPDSLYKATRGGKGVGHLVCIQTFHKMQVESVFQEDKTWKKRNFVFQQEAPELAQSLEVDGEDNWLTEVKLSGLRDAYDSQAAIQVEQLLDWLTEHFLPALLEKPSWLRSLVLKDGRKTKDLMQLVSGGAAWSEAFKVKNYDFAAKCYALKKMGKSDMVRLVAGGRVVDANTRSIEHYIPHLERVSDEATHVVLVRSPFFDEHINDARNGVSFSEEGEESAILGITAAQFRQRLAEALTKPLEMFIDRSVQELKKKVVKVVQEDAPYYKPLLLGYFESKDFIDLQKSARNEEILTSLDGYRRRTAINLKKESKRLAKASADNANYWDDARKLADSVEMSRKVALAEYVSLRKIVLQHLDDLLNIDRGGKASREEQIHNLIFPQRIDTESAPGTDHQLWIIDERLESHHYLASDQPMDGAKGDRPDLLIALDRPGAFATEPFSRSRGYDRVVLVEFKRALDDLSTVPTDKLPHRQMMRYALEISKGDAVHYKTGRVINAASDARFYLYSVCELPKETLERLERDEHFTLSPTGDGAFSVAANGRYYLEYISLAKLLEDAQARNQAFFQKLGLEP
jgi:hypothetical protein